MARAANLPRSSPPRRGDCRPLRPLRPSYGKTPVRGVLVTHRGFAFSGVGEIARVDVNEDDGAGWKPAVLGQGYDRFAWKSEHRQYEGRVVALQPAVS
ncbi:MAG: hypothetical protein ACM369_16185, partial [Acidobacteriota bacterium]